MWWGGSQHVEKHLNYFVINPSRMKGFKFQLLSKFVRFYLTLECIHLHTVHKQQHWRVNDKILFYFLTSVYNLGLVNRANIFWHLIIIRSKVEKKHVWHFNDTHIIHLMWKVPCWVTLFHVECLQTLFTTLFNTVTLHSQVAYDSGMLQLQENTHNVAFCAMTLCEHQCSGKTSCLHVQAWSVNGAEKLSWPSAHHKDMQGGKRYSSNHSQIWH